MNSPRNPLPTSRWVREMLGSSSEPTELERQVLGEVLLALRGIRHGSVTLSVQDGKVVQLDVSEKRRFS